MVGLLEIITMAATGALGGFSVSFVLFGFIAAIVGLFVGAVVVGGSYAYVERRTNGGKFPIV